jgi:hypothetical protein
MSTESGDQSAEFPVLDESTTRRSSRRTMLRQAGLAMLAACLGDLAFASRSQRGRSAARPAPEKPEPAAPISGISAYQDLIAYYNLGDHRTATKGDLRTSDWIATELRKAGFVTSFESFTVNQFFVSKTNLVVDGTVMASFPLWPPRTTGPGPIEARLAVYDRNRSAQMAGTIALLKFPFDARSSLLPGSIHGELIEGASRARARAAIAITEGPTGEIIALNSMPDLRPWPIPVLLAPGRKARELTDAAAGGARASLLLDGKDEPAAAARNVVGRLRTGKKVIVVSTPQSGWFRCAGERGPGIGLFLGLARWASKHLLDTGLIFVSTSGHELGEVGMEHFLREQAPSSGSTTVWLHLGAGIATWKWEQGEIGLRRLKEVDANRLLMCSKDLEPVLTPLFADLAGLKPDTSRAVGEMELLLDHGYRAFAIAAGHRYHHTPADNPETTAPELLEPVAAALVNALQAIQDQRF